MICWSGVSRSGKRNEEKSNRALIFAKLSGGLNIDDFKLFPKNAQRAFKCLIFPEYQGELPMRNKRFQGRPELYWQEYTREFQTLKEAEDWINKFPGGGSYGEVLNEPSPDAKDFICTECGKCCLKVDHIDLVPEDISRFKEHGREDLYTDEMLVEWDYFGASGFFRNQGTFRCPFLRKVRGKELSRCSIYDVRPNTCRKFATYTGREHAEGMGCPGWGHLEEKKYLLFL